MKIWKYEIWKVEQEIWHPHDRGVELGNNGVGIPDNEVETRQSGPSMCCFHLWF